MLEDIIGAVVRAQLGDVRKRTTGAVLEVASLGMIGLATVLAFVAAHLWLSSRVEAWLSAVILASVAFVIAMILMLAGRSLLHRRTRRHDTEVQSLLDGLGALSQRGSKAAPGSEPGPAIIGAALAAGLLLGRSVRR
jgi:hypothetical protein